MTVSIKTCLSFRTTLRRQQNNYSADADVSVHYIRKYPVRDVAEGPAAGEGAEEDSAEGVEVGGADCRGHETVICADEGHHGVADEEVGLGHGHVMVFVGLGGYEVEDGRRTLHAEEAAHDAAEGAGTDLGGECRAYVLPDLVLEEAEIEADEDKKDSQYDSHGAAFYPGEEADGDGGDDDEGQQYGQETLQGDVLAESGHYCNGGGECKEAGQGCRFAVGWHEEGEGRHYEYAEPEAGRALYETGSCRKEEYVKDCHAG